VFHDSFVDYDDVRLRAVSSADNGGNGGGNGGNGGGNGGSAGGGNGNGGGSAGGATVDGKRLFLRLK
jgi:hypothetical protein